ncbi:MAG: 2OG-Fe(II) oxygenase [Rhodobacteraceae bacterium]|nr:2OG-Fe(II) oxygenase [Paracoccaceae bacterium]
MLSEKYRDGETVERLREIYSQEGVVVLEGFLEPDFADGVREGIAEIQGKNLWYQVLCGDPSFYDETIDCFSEEGRGCHFAFRYDMFPVCNMPLRSFLAMGGFTSRRDIRESLSCLNSEKLRRIAEAPVLELGAGNALIRLSTFLGSDGFASLMSSLCSVPSPFLNVTAFVSRFLGGHYLSLHTDGEEGRLCNFVLQLTDFWLPHWGGDLVLLNYGSRHPERTFVPQFNSLIIFKVPRPHVVTSVAAVCPKPRYACSGWVQKK